MLTDATIVFYKDNYDTIYIVDKTDYVNARDIEYQTTILTPKILGQPEKARIQNGIIYKYGTVEIRRDVYSLSGLTGTFVGKNIFISQTPINKVLYEGKTVSVRNIENGVLRIFTASIKKVKDDLVTIILNDVFNGLPVLAMKGAAHLSLNKKYELLTSAVYYGEDYIRITYNCYENTSLCGSRIVPTEKFRFGPTDNFKYHLDNAVTDASLNYITGGSCFTDVPVYSTLSNILIQGVSDLEEHPLDILIEPAGKAVWGIVAPNGTIVSSQDTLLTWVSVWG